MSCLPRQSPTYGQLLHGFCGKRMPLCGRKSADSIRRIVPSSRRPNSWRCSSVMVVRISRVASRSVLTAQKSVAYPCSSGCSTRRSSRTVVAPCHQAAKLLSLFVGDRGAQILHSTSRLRKENACATSAIPVHPRITNQLRIERHEEKVF
jgi:hypothetical protein